MMKFKVGDKVVAKAHVRKKIGVVVETGFYEPTNTELALVVWSDGNEALWAGHALEKVSEND